MIVLIALAAAAADPIPETDNFGEPFPAFVPADVRLFVIDAQGCTHFSGEPSSDEYPERKAFLEEMIVKTCTDIDKRKSALESRYKDSAEVLKIVSDAWDE